jgi:predicted transcriptional regulator
LTSHRSFFEIDCLILSNANGISLTEIMRLSKVPIGTCKKRLVDLEQKGFVRVFYVDVGSKGLKLRIVDVLDRKRFYIVTELGLQLLQKVNDVMKLYCQFDGEVIKVLKNRVLLEE